MDAKRPWIASIVSLIIFLLGLVGTLAAIILCGLLSLNPEILFPFKDFYLLVAVIWFVIGPLLIIAGYYLWKMKKWAAWLAVAIVSFDLVSTPFIDLLFYKIDLGSFFAWVMDIVIILLIASVWKHFS